jgi:hypothetical protein
LPERTAAEFRDYGVTSLEKLIESFFPVTEPDKKNEIVTEFNGACTPFRPRIGNWH